MVFKLRVTVTLEFLWKSKRNFLTYNKQGCGSAFIFADPDPGSALQTAM